MAQRRTSTPAAPPATGWANRIIANRITGEMFSTAPLLCSHAHPFADMWRAFLASAGWDRAVIAMVTPTGDPHLFGVVGYETWDRDVYDEALERAHRLT